MDLVVQREQLTHSQWAFVRARDPFLCFAGGYGSGKSTALAIKLLVLVVMNPGFPGLLIGQTLGSLHTNVLAEMWRIIKQTLPASMWPVYRGGSTNRHLLFPNDSMVYLRSAENPAGYEGQSVAWVLGDEIRYWSRRAYEVAIARARMRRAPLVQRAFASTPEMNWMFDEFGMRKPMHRTITAGTRENAHNLEPNYIEGLRASYSTRLQKAILDGLFTILEGAVYENVDPDFWSSKHAIDFNPREHDGKTYLAVDPGYRRSAWLWIREIAPTKWVVFDQHMGETQSDSASVQLVNDKPWEIDQIWCDPAADATQSALSMDTLDMLDAIITRNTDDPICYINAPFTSIKYGVDKVRTLLGNPAEGQPIRLYFARRLKDYEDNNSRGIVRSLQSYRYPEMKDNRPVGDEPLKDGTFDHACDSVRYWGVGMFLANPRLRALDPKIEELADGKRGYKIAA